MRIGDRVMLERPGIYGFDMQRRGTILDVHAPNGVRVLFDRVGGWMPSANGTLVFHGDLRPLSAHERAEDLADAAR